jgi:hypothetical protein
MVFSGCFTRVHGLPLLFALFFALDCAGSSPVTARAAELSESEIFRRCHSLFTSIPPERLDPLLAQVRAGDVSGKDACMVVLEAGVFPAGSLELSATQIEDARITGMLKNFNLFHNRFFQRNDPNTLDDHGRHSVSLREQELGHYFTAALFAPSMRLEQVLLRNTSLEPKRLGAVSTRLNHPYSFYTNLTGLTFNLDEPSGSAPSPGRTRATYSPIRIMNGMFIGVEATPTRNLSALSAKYSQGAPEFGQTDTNKNFGPGLPGDGRFVALNLGGAFGGTFDGALKVPRRYSEAIFSSLLCRELPVIRPSDVPAAVVDPSSPIAFRRQKSCMQCHHTMDRLAGVARNAMIVRSSTLADTASALSTMHLADARDMLNPPAPVQGVLPYAFQPPSGHLLYRSQSGDLVDLPLPNGIQDLASALATAPDFYSCVSRRYYEFMTGVRVAAFEPGSKPLSSLSPEDAAHIREVSSLGARLMQHQSLRELVREILATPAFRRRQ